MCNPVVLELITGYKEGKQLQSNQTLRACVRKIINSLTFHIAAIVNTCTGCGWVQSLKFGTAQGCLRLETKSIIRIYGGDVVIRWFFASLTDSLICTSTPF